MNAAVPTFAATLYRNHARLAWRLERLESPARQDSELAIERRDPSGAWALILHRKPALGRRPLV